MTIFVDYQPDNLDWQILRELQEDARLPFAELGRRVGLSAPAVAGRIQKMKDAGIITGYSVALDPERLGVPITAFIRISLSGLKADKVIEKAKTVPGIMECHRATGNDCIIMKVRVASIKKLEELTDEFTSLGQLTTSVVLSTAFERDSLDRAMFEGVDGKS